LEHRRPAPVDAGRVTRDRERRRLLDALVEVARLLLLENQARREVEQFQVLRMPEIVDDEPGIDGMPADGEPLRRPVTGDHDHGRLGEVEELPTPAVEPLLVVEETMPDRDVPVTREKLADHATERVFLIRDRPLPVSLEDEEPGS